MDMWHEIFTKYIKDFDAIDLLRAHSIIDDEDIINLKNKLLVDIICTMRSEVE